MKLPVRIQADAAGQPLLAGNYYWVQDANDETILNMPILHGIGCVGTVQLLRRVVRLMNTEGAIHKALSGLVEMGEQTLKDMGGCDHSVNICCCQDQALVDQGRAVLKRLDAPTWPGEQRQADLFQDLRECLADMIDRMDGMGTVRQLEAFGTADAQDTVDRAKLLLIELQRAS